MKDKDSILLENAYESIKRIPKIVMGGPNPWGDARKQLRSYPKPYKANPQNPESENEKLKEKVKNVLYRGKRKALHDVEGSEILRDYIEGEIRTYDELVDYFLENELSAYLSGPLSLNSSDDDIIKQFVIDVVDQLLHGRNKKADI